MRAWSIVLVLAACSKSHEPPARPGASTSDDVTSEQPTAAAPIVDQTKPPPPSSSPDDHQASAEAIYDATNYVAPAELAYSRKLTAVVYPACGGGEGPGEHCGLAAYDHAGKELKIADDLQVTWFRYNHDKNDSRTKTVAKLKASLDALDTFRMDRVEWRGAPLDLPGFGKLAWNDQDKSITASRDGRSKTVPTNRGDMGGGLVNLFWSKDAPVAVAQVRYNPASGGREGYVVFIQLIVVPRP